MASHAVSAYGNFLDPTTPSLFTHEVVGSAFGSTPPLLLPGENADADRVWSTEVVEPALFARRAAPVAVSRAYGVRSAVPSGHSAGEYAAHTIGLFPDTVVPPLDLSGDPDFAILRRVRNTSTAAYEHRATPVDEPVGAPAPRSDPEPGAADAPRPWDAEPATALKKSPHEPWCAEPGARYLLVDRSFFQLGGHSLSSIRLPHRMADGLYPHLSTAEFFRTPTVKDLAAQGGGGTTDPAEGAAAVPLASSPRRLWRRHCERAGPAAHNVAQRVDLRRESGPHHLAQALVAFVARHDALRGRCAERDREHLVEMPAGVPVEVPVTDPTAQGDGEGAARRRRRRDEASRLFAPHRTAPRPSATAGR
ncbi:phosphopantetheine-binding protein [Streptomyces prunicolor]